MGYMKESPIIQIDNKEIRKEVDLVKSHLAQRPTQEEIENNLNLKRDKSVPIGLNDASPELLSAIEGGTGTTFNLLSVPRDGVVSERKTTFIKTSSNLLDLSKLSLDKSISGTDGTLTNSASNDVSDFIETAPLDTYTFTGVSRSAWYGLDKSFLSSTLHDNTMTHTVEAPENAYFIRMVINKTLTNTAQLNSGSELLTYEPYKKPKFVEGIGIPASNLEDIIVGVKNTTFIQEGKNLFDKSKATKGYYIASATGELFESSTNVVSDFITVKPNTQYSFTDDGEFGIIIVYFDSNKTRIGGTGSTHTPITTPDGTAFVRFSFQLSLLDTMQLEEGEINTPYEPYGLYLDETIIPKNNGQQAIASHLSEKKIVCFGDSITGMYDDSVAYPEIIKQRLGAETYNVGFSGTRMSDTGVDQYKTFSLPNLVDSIISGDWSLQNDDVGLGSTNYQPHLDRLKGIDFNNIDIITIFYGANDFGGNVELDNQSDPLDTTTFLGACRYSVKSLLEAYPHLKIVFISSTWRSDVFGQTNSVGNSVKDYVEAILSLGAEVNIPVINLYYNGQINQYNSTYYLQPDGLHPNQNAGLPLIGNIVASHLQSFI